MEESNTHFIVLSDNPVEPPALETNSNASGPESCRDKDLLGYTESIASFSDIVFRSRDSAPFTVGIFAEWGQGKSSAMRLMQQQLEAQSKEVCCVWFYPWKYHTREEVWQGLVLTLVRAVQQHSSLGAEWRRKKSAVKLALVEVLWGNLLKLLGIGKADAVIKAVIKEPWSPEQLHKFENLLDDLLGHLHDTQSKPLGNNAVLVLMVDDLDRCLPESAAAVLEALKLVLNRPRLITVLGIAELEVERALNSLYAHQQEASGKPLRDDWGQDYLRKIIQLPYYLPRPSSSEFSHFVEQSLLRSGIAAAVPNYERWAPVLAEVCNHNLREVKRFVNRFVIDWGKAAANRRMLEKRDMETAQKAGTEIRQRTPLNETTVLFMMAADVTERGFLQAPRSRLQLFIDYQNHFLSEADGDEREPGEGYWVSTSLRRLFQDCMQGEPPLIPRFETIAEINPYLQFGREEEEVLVAQPEASQSTAGPQQAAVVESPLDSDDVADNMSVDEAIKPKSKAKSKFRTGQRKKAVSGRIKLGLKALDELLSAEDFDGAYKQLKELTSQGHSVQNRQALPEIFSRLNDWAALTKDYGAAVELWQVMRSRYEHWMERDWQPRSAEDNPGDPILIPRLMSLQAELHQRLQRLVMDDPHSKQAEQQRGWVLALSDSRAGIALNTSTGLPELSWVAIEGNEALNLGTRLGTVPDKQASDSEQWPKGKTIQVQAFWMAAYPVTVAQYRAFVDDGGYQQEEHWSKAGLAWLKEESRQAPAYWDDVKWTADNLPVVGVSWYEAVAYCQWLNAKMDGQLGQYEIRLPTEAEWEWAARGARGDIWPAGNDWQPCNTEEAGLQRSTPVGGFPQAARAVNTDGMTNHWMPPGQAAEHIYDQAGNVWEWCLTKWQNEYSDAWQAGEWSEGYLSGDDLRILRGGSWRHDASWCRGAARDGDDPRGRSYGGGFRCCVATSSLASAS